MITKKILIKEILPYEYFYIYLLVNLLLKVGWFTVPQIQSNFNGSNTFGTMKISSRQGLFEPLRVYYRARSGGIIGVSLRFFFIMKVYCVFSLESPQRGDSNEYTQYSIFQYKKENIP